MGRADTHLHTEYSGYSNLGVMKFPESVTSPAQQVDKGRRNGMDVIAIDRSMPAVENIADTIGYFS